MKILVCIKQVPGSTQVEIDEKNGTLKRDGVESKLNPYDLYALETAMRLKEEHSASVAVLTMGPPQCEEAVREAFMMGADDAYLLSAEESYFLYSFEENQSGMEVPFLRITVEDQSGSEEELRFEGVVYFMNEGKGIKESHRFIYEGGEGTFLIPLTTSPWWSYSDDIQSMMLDFISSSLPGKQISLKLEFETWKGSEG